MLQEISISIILIILLILLFVNPFMSGALFMMVVVGLIIAFGLFTTFIWRERAEDERESYHKMIAGRIAFLAGAGVLVLGIVIQSFAHELDPWLIFTLGIMIIGKIAGLIYGKTKN